MKTKESLKNEEEGGQRGSWELLRRGLVWGGLYPAAAGAVGMRTVTRFRAVLVAVVLVALVAPVAPASQAAPKKPLELAKVGFKVESATDGDAAGSDLVVGDFDGDGVADLAVGAPCDATNAAGAGAVYILYGPITPGRSLADADAKLLGVRPGDFAGEFLTVLDIDGDGIDDLVVGVPGPFVGTGPVADGCFELGPVQPGFNRPGEAYVLRGGRRLTGELDAIHIADTVITGLAPMDFASLDLGGSDLNGDGKDDLVVGATGPGAGAGTGAAFVFAGGDLPARMGALEADAQLVGEQPVDLFGYRIAGGDVDGDGTDDLLIAAPGLHPGRAGNVYVFLGGELPSGVISATSADIRLEGTPGDRAAHGGLVVGDLNGDGFDDIVVGARLAGVTYVFYGPLAGRGTVPLADADVHVGAGPNREAGWAVAVANLDGDDRSDLIIGAYRDTTGGELAGAVHRLNGPLEGEVDATDRGFLLVGEPGDRAGWALAVGDVTGNRFDDLVVGAPAVDGGKPGAVYIVSGDG